ncbi:hypothetical protein D3C76_1534980 [compost metagenome]
MGFEKGVSVMRLCSIHEPIHSAYRQEIQALCYPYPLRHTMHGDDCPDQPMLCDWHVRNFLYYSLQLVL